MLSDQLDSRLNMLLLALTSLLSSHAQAPVKDDAKLERKVEQKLKQMSLEQKLQIIGGVDSFYIRGFPDLGIPRVKMSDGPVGVRNDGPTTAYPAGVCLAATWDPHLGTAYGDGIGKDARGRGVNVWLGPGVNLARIVQNGRNFEYLGEDPYLASRMAVNLIKAVQKNGVVATVKHFAGNEHENDRNRDNSIVDEATLRELYLRPFQAAVEEGGVSAVMCGYNKLNGPYDSASKYLLNDVLKKDWKFRGLVMSDWGAVHETKAVAQHGMDLEMPSGEFMNPEKLTPLVNDGTVPLSAIDDKVRRILRVEFEYGFDRNRPWSGPHDDPRNDNVARKVAEAGTVLLKNDNHFLPLRPSKIKHVLVLGSNGATPMTGGGGSSYTTPLHSESLLAALQKQYGASTKFDYVITEPSTDPKAFKYDKFLLPDESGPGLKAEYFDNINLSGDPKVTQVDPNVNYNWNKANPSPVGPLNFSVRWTGVLKPTITSTALFISRSDDGMRVFINDKPVLDQWADHGAETITASVPLQAGEDYRIRIEYYQAGGDAVAQFGLVETEDAKRNAMIKNLLGRADAVIACVGFKPETESEGSDRPFNLSQPQQQMLDIATSAGKKVVIINNSGAGVNLAPWLGKSAAIIQAWYGGQDGAAVMADILYGKVNPSGKLPTSFPRKLNGTYYESAYPPVDHTIIYKEKLLMGYRWFDTKHVKPLFPFGYGLSYTNFKLDKPSAKITSGVIYASVVLHNTGYRPGADVVQVYEGMSKMKAGYPVKELKGFKKVVLQKGQSKKVVIAIPVKDLAHWDVAKHGWKVFEGGYKIYIGDSSANVKSVSVTVK